MATYYPSGYSAMSRKGEFLADMCRSLAAPMEAFLKTTGADTVVVRGNSGVCVAYAMHVLFPGRFQWLIARKSAEQSASHGEMFEPLDNERICVNRYVILDDFVASGGTIGGVERDISDGWDAGDPDRPVCVGLVLYQPLSSDIKEFTVRDSCVGLKVYPTLTR